VTRHVFMVQGVADVDAELATPYPGGHEHLTDLMALADLQIRRAASAGRSARGPQVAELGSNLAALEARIDESRRWIAARLAASGADANRFPARALAARLRLDPLDLDTVLLLAAVELDGRLLAHLRSAEGTVPPALTSLRVMQAVGDPDLTPAAWMARMLAPGSLVERGVVTRSEDSAGLPLSVAPLRLARPVLAFLLGQPPEDPALAGVVRRVEPATSGRVSDRESRLADAIGDPSSHGFCVWLSGPPIATRDVAARVAAVASRPLRHIDAAALAGERPRASHDLLRRLALQLALDDSAGYVEIRDWVPAMTSVMQVLSSVATGPLLLAAEDEPPGLATWMGRSVHYHVPPISEASRRTVWQEELGLVGADIPAADVDELADDFPLSKDEIADVVFSAVRGRVTDAPLAADDLRAAALARQRSRLGKLTQFVPPSFTWDDLVLPAEEMEQLLEIASRQVYRHMVLTDWGMSEKLPYGTGTAALFAGPPGTGKTMAASVLARELGRELHRVDLSRVVDKYVGETEKNLGRIFDAAQRANAILLFDEADSLFGKRTAVQSSNDRYANLETNYLLQRIEEHPGVSILTTNNVQNIDEAFARRIPFRVHFPFPDGATRAEIWRRSFPDRMPRQGEIDFQRLGEAFELSGGHIKSAVVRAAFEAAATGQPVTVETLVRAVRAEFETMGKLAPRLEL
jgi:ATPase family associated with various cellular activities (AAA)/Winged helix domain, variant